MLALFLACRLLFPAGDIYQFSVTGIDGKVIHFSDFKGKHMLLVNIASGSPYANQIPHLEQLYEQLKDSLVVIAFPSNDFGNEPADDATLKNLLSSQYNVRFLIAAKGPVSGTGQPGLFNWLANGSLNGTMSHPVQADFQKYLINANGQVVAFFMPFVDPMDQMVQDQVRQL
ncbi:MAG TPA: glutathione peroxidase [Puia sp.]|nr:glutathione peroxidase [Puia sp.]